MILLKKLFQYIITKIWNHGFSLHLQEKKILLRLVRCPDLLRLLVRRGNENIFLSRIMLCVTIILPLANKSSCITSIIDQTLVCINDMDWLSGDDFSQTLLPANTMSDLFQLSCKRLLLDMHNELDYQSPIFLIFMIGHSR